MQRSVSNYTFVKSALFVHLFTVFNGTFHEAGWEVSNSNTYMFRKEAEKYMVDNSGCVEHNYNARWEAMQKCPPSVNDKMPVRTLGVS